LDRWSPAQDPSNLQVICYLERAKKPEQCGPISAALASGNCYCPLGNFPGTVCGLPVAPGLPDISVVFVDAGASDAVLDIATDADSPAACPPYTSDSAGMCAALPCGKQTGTMACTNLTADPTCWTHCRYLKQNGVHCQDADKTPTPCRETRLMTEADCDCLLGIPVATCTFEDDGDMSCKQPAPCEKSVVMTKAACDGLSGKLAAGDFVCGTTPKSAVGKFEDLPAKCMTADGTPPPVCPDTSPWPSCTSIQGFTGTSDPWDLCGKDCGARGLRWCLGKCRYSDFHEATAEKGSYWTSTTLFATKEHCDCLNGNLDIEIGVVCAQGSPGCQCDTFDETPGPFPPTINGSRLVRARRRFLVRGPFRIRIPWVARGKRYARPPWAQSLARPATTAIRRTRSTSDAAKH